MEIKILASGSKGNCYFVTDGKTNLLLDAGIPFSEIQRKLDFQTADIDACLITHRHSDHAKGIRTLEKRGIKVYTPENVKPPEHFRIKSIVVTPGWVTHDVPCLAYTLSADNGENLFYATDTATLPFPYDDLTYIMVEANYSEKILAENVVKGGVADSLAERIRNNHLSIDTLCEWLNDRAEDEIRQIHLLHLSDKNSDAAEFKRRVQEITGAEVYVA